MNIFRKLSSKISIKIWSGFILILLIMAFVVGYNYFQLNAIRNNILELRDRRIPNLLAAENLLSGASNQRAATRGYMATGSSNYIREPNEATRLVEESIKFLDENVENRKRFQIVKETVEAFKPHPPKIVSIHEEQGQEAAMDYLATTAAPAAEKLFSVVEGYVKYQEETINSDVSISENIINATIQMALILLLIALILGTVIAAIISRIISRPLVRLTEAANKLAEGDLNVEVDIRSKDEIGVLSEAIAKMVDKTNEAMTNINTAYEQVAAGAKQISDSSMDLSQGAAEQASSVQQLTATLQQISSQTELNAENANKVNRLVKLTEKNAIQGNEQMQNMLVAMDEINESSNNISKIIKVIDEIAFQTNILALNAAVEAARAGQHGKGFAVVAEEVRNLAARSADAAKETTEMIENSIHKTEDGMKIADETAKGLDKIIKEVSRTVVLINEVADL